MQVSETGSVLTAGDGIARVYGLSGALAGELLEFEGSGEKVQGMVLNLEEDNVGVAILGRFDEVIAFDADQRMAMLRSGTVLGVRGPGYKPLLPLEPTGPGGAGQVQCATCHDPARGHGRVVAPRRGDPPERRDDRHAPRHARRR